MRRVCLPESGEAIDPCPAPNHRQLRLCSMTTEHASARAKWGATMQPATFLDPRPVSRHRQLRLCRTAPPSRRLELLARNVLRQALRLDSHMRSSDSLTSTSDTLAFHVQQVRDRGESRRNRAQDRGRTVVPKVFVHRDRDDDHAACNDIADHGNGNESECRVAGKGLNDV